MISGPSFRLCVPFQPTKHLHIAFPDFSGRRGGRGGRRRGGGVPVFDGASSLAQSIRANAPAGCQVFVGNLPWTMVWQDLKVCRLRPVNLRCLIMSLHANNLRTQDLCSSFGDIKRADVMLNADGRSRGFVLCPACLEQQILQILMRACCFCSGQRIRTCYICRRRQCSKMHCRA